MTPADRALALEAARRAVARLAASRATFADVPAAAFALGKQELLPEGTLAAFVELVGAVDEWRGAAYPCKSATCQRQHSGGAWHLKISPETLVARTDQALRAAEPVLEALLSKEAAP
mgnify:CR=1 FL=1